MPDFQIINEPLKAVWVRRLSDSNGTASWSHIPLSYLQPAGGLFLLQCNFDLKLLKVDIPIDFYTEALCTWQKIYSLPFNVTKDTRLAIFQYKIIYHILPTNSTHDKCHLCGEKQT